MQCAISRLALVIALTWILALPGCGHDGALNFITVEPDKRDDHWRGSGGSLHRFGALLASTQHQGHHRVCHLGVQRAADHFCGPAWSADLWAWLWHQRE